MQRKRKLTDEENKENDGEERKEGLPEKATVRSSVLLRLKSRVSRSRHDDARGFLAPLSGVSWTNWDLLSVEDECVEAAMASSVHLDDHAPLSIDVSAASVHCYHLNNDGPLCQSISVDDTVSTGSLLWQLPCVEFECIWSSLVFEDNVKKELLSYVSSLIDLSIRGVDSNVISVHRMILLYGPPGTGKTSLCKAIAQQASVLFNDTYTSSVLLEVNSHSLFSKWFSESGKLVQGLFTQVEEMASDPKCLVFVLIDEAESLCMSRTSSSSNGDPSDSIRVVNAMLTQIDKLRRYPNVFILCTSNMSGSLDAALTDRMDLVREIGVPGRHAIASIVRSGLSELQRIGLVGPSGDDAALRVASAGVGLSARSMRQVPALVCAKRPLMRMEYNEAVALFQTVMKEKLSEKE